jgi:hypothetical protein
MQKATYLFSAPQKGKVSVMKKILSMLNEFFSKY